MKYDKDKFIDILEIIKKNLRINMNFSEIRYWETNPSTQVVGFRSKNNKKSGIIVVGENNNKIVIEVIVDDEKDKNKGAPIVEMDEIKINLLNQLIEWLGKYCE